MTKEEYLNKLNELLQDENIDNIDEIIEEVNQKYDLGAMAGLTDDEIIADIGSPEEILNRNKKVHVDVKTLDIEISDVFSSDIEFRERDENGIDIRLSKDLKNIMNVEVSDDKITIRPISKVNHYRILRSSEISIEYGPNIDFNKVSLYTVSGDGEIEKIKCNTVKIETVSGDFDIDYLEAESAVLKTVSGDINVSELKTKVCTISTVSGDINVDSGSITSLVANTISGDIDVCASVKASKCSKISGDITINNVEE